MDEKLISVIVPVYNVERYLRQCIESITNQSYKNLQIILIDDGSKDNSGKICDEYAEKDKRIEVIHKENAGVSAARNTGLDNAKGEWITFVDADDWVEKNFCEILIKKAIENESDCIACGYNKVYCNNTEKNVVLQCYEITGIEFVKDILYVQNGLGFCHMKLWKKSVIDKVRFEEDLKVGEDALFCIQVGENINKFFMLDIPLYNYRINRNSAVRKFDEEYVRKYLSAMILTKERVEKQFGKHEEIQKNIYNYIIYHVLLICVNYCCNPNKTTSLFEQKDEIQKVCSIPIFKEAIKKSTNEKLSLTRKITVLTLKCKMYFITAVIGRIRQKQL